MKLRTISWIAFALAAFACSGPATSPETVDQTSPSVTDSDCPISEYHNDVLPKPFAETINGPTVWMGGPDAYAVLFYAQGGEEVTIGTNGIQGPGINSKILWLVDGDPEGPLTMVGVNMTTGTKTVQDFDGGGNYPSVPALPDEGCWQLTITVDSTERLSITLPAENRSD